MRCKICDRDSDTVTLTTDCAECQEAIWECLMGYEDEEEQDGTVPLLDEEFELVG